MDGLIDIRRWSEEIMINATEEKKDKYCYFVADKIIAEAKFLDFLDFEATERHAGYKWDGKLDPQ